ncbi:MAG: hypothetical protein R3320_14275, partial [Nitriliruptorales bacterium]|nr:hypothetical protein [Nitriliruptorales bacterium]
MRTIPGLVPAVAAQSSQGAVSEPTESPITFSMLGFEHSRGAEVEYRVSQDGANWSPWDHAEPVTHGE